MYDRRCVRADFIGLFDPATPKEDKPNKLEALEKAAEPKRCLSDADDRQAPNCAREIFVPWGHTPSENSKILPILVDGLYPAQRIRSSIAGGVAFMGYTADCGDKNLNKFSNGRNMCEKIYVPESHINLILGDPTADLIVVDDIVTWRTVKIVLTALHFQLGHPESGIHFTAAGWWREKKDPRGDTIVTYPLRPYSQIMRSERNPGKEYHKPILTEYGEIFSMLGRD